MFKVILVDAGGILYNNIIEDTNYLEQVGVAVGVAPEVLRRELDSRDWSYETDVQTSLDVVNEIVSEAGADRQLSPREHLSLYMQAVQLRPWAVARVARLRANPQSKVVLANNEAQDWDRAKDAVFHHFDMFDAVAASWKLRAVKPSAAWIGRMEEMLEIDRSLCVLFDDASENVEEALKHGLPAHVVGNETEFDSALEREGLI